MPPPSRVLLVRPSALGDVCRTVPLLASMRSAWPDARIDWLVQDTFADAVVAHPALSGVVPFDRRGLGRAARSLRLATLSDWAARLRGARYDLVIDAQGLFRSGLFARLTGSPRRIGHASAREGAWLFYSQRVPDGGREHTVERMLALVEAAGAPPMRDMRLYAPPAREGEERTDIADRYAVVAPTSRWAGKQWPADRFASVISELLSSGAERVLLVGGAGERAQCGAIFERHGRDGRVVDLVGATSIAGLMRVIEGASLVLGNDSAALHMAVGFERPMVGLFGPTDVSRVGPYGREDDVIQRVSPGERLDHKDEAAGRSLMERISVCDVAEACAARLSRACARTPA